MKTEEIILCQQYILLDRDGGILIDTGSPFSFHQNEIINFGGKDYSCPTEFGGFNCDTISQGIQCNIAGLLGMDILSQFDNVVFDYANHQILLNSDVDEQNLVSLNSGSIMSSSYIELEIEGSCARLFVDTGAPVSYISPNFTAGKNNLGTIEDFHPFCGKFTSNTYSLLVRVNGIDKKMIFGNLPPQLQQYGITDIDGVIGYELFSHYKMMLRQGMFYIIAK